MSELIPSEGIAVIGMAGRFPMAASVDELWANLVAAKDCFREFTVDELVATGLPQQVAEAPNYVRRCPVIANHAAFDAHLFGYSPKEAEVIDPQQRILMECALEALEQAGHDPKRFDGAIGIWAGCGVANYFLKNLLSQPGHFEAVSNFNTIVGNDKDYLASRIAYKLNLRGPAMVVQSACSTSLVAVHLACQALLTYQCDMALAGGVSFQFPRAPGYLFHEGEIFSPDGFCRTFDKGANGTVLGEGGGLVALRRLEDALTSGDTILAVIRGSAVNNDGADRAGYTAPGLAGQSEVITMAHAVAGVSADEISYVEAHGTATALGDLIEVSALTKAFRQTTQERGFCGLGTVKTNIGHLDVAAGIAGLIKTICSLQHRQLPGTLHFTEPNPELKLPDSPFFVVDRLMEWKPRHGRRLAGVSSFGLGGTNAHLIVEEFAAPKRSTPSRQRWHILPLSAATESALQKSCSLLAAHLKGPGADGSLADVAFTLVAGRQPLRHRLCVVADSLKEAAVRLEKPDAVFGAQGKAGRAERPVVFLFSGQGTQYPGMAAGLYREHPVFRSSMERCAQIIGPIGGRNSILDIFYGSDEGNEALLNQTAVSQPALFAIEYSLARLWEAYGVKPIAVAGHSIGEYVAACEAGIFSVDDALALVCERGRLMQSMEPGAMLAVLRPEAEVRRTLPAGLDLAVINAPAICVVSGPIGDIDALAKALEKQGVTCRRLRTSHAFHSRMMEGAMRALTDAVAKTARTAPRIPVASNLTGMWMSDEEAVDPSYWARHMRNTVRFSDDLATVARRFESAVLLEVGPGNALCSIVQQQPEAVSGLPGIASVRHALQKVDDEAYLARGFGALWCHGVAVDLGTLYSGEARNRARLPGYPFEREVLYIASESRQVSDEHPHRAGSRYPWNRASNALEQRNTLPDQPCQEEITLESLIELWNATLGTTQIGPDDNFFDLGGHSLLAVSLAGKIQEAFGLKLPLSALLNAPTPRQSLRLLAESSRSAGSHALVPIVQRGTRPPVFLFHSHGGNVLEYYRLATLLGQDRPVYAIQCHGVDGSPLIPLSIEEMTQIYLKEIRTVQPNGPYYLGGYCFGGMLAVEAALQLRAANQETALVFMINAVTNAYPQQQLPGTTALRKASGRILDRLALERSNLVGKSFRGQLQQIRSRAGRTHVLALVKAARLLETCLAKLGRQQPLKKHSLAHHLEQLAENNDAAWLRYAPKPYDGRVLFFHALRQPRELKPDPMLGWTEYLGGRVSQLGIAGFRQNLLDPPYVFQIAEAINREIAGSAG